MESKLSKRPTNSLGHCSSKIANAGTRNSAAERRFAFTTVKIVHENGVIQFNDHRIYPSADTFDLHTAGNPRPLEEYALIKVLVRVVNLNTARKIKVKDC